MHEINCYKTVVHNVVDNYWTVCEQTTAKRNTKIQIAALNEWDKMTNKLSKKFTDSNDYLTEPTRHNVFV